MPDTPSGPAQPPPDAPSRLRDVLAELSVGLQQFWQGYWQSPPGC